MQINFNDTNFINVWLTQRTFLFDPWPKPVVGEMEMHSVANLTTLQTPLATFLSFKKAAKHYLVSETRRYCRASARSCIPRRTPLSLSLSLSLSTSALFSERRRGAALSVKHRYYVASLILHASIAKITAQLLSLSYVYLISSDDSSIIRIFVQINILEGRAFYVVLMSRVSITIFYSFRCLTTETVKIYKWKQFYWEFSCIKIQYVGTERQTNVIINNIYTFCMFKRRAVLLCKNVNRFV